MYKIVFTKYGEKTFNSLTLENRNRIIKKLTSFKKVDNIYHFTKIVYNLTPATHRLRIGSFRLLINIDGNNIYICKVGYRKDIYK